MRLSRSLFARAVAGAVAVGVLAAASACAGGSTPTNPAPTSAGPAITTDAALHAALPAAIRDAGVIRFAGDSHPPYRAVGTDGTTVTGIDPDLQAALGTLLGVRTEISIVSGLPAALSGMLSGRYDAFNGPVKDTADREKDFDAIVWMVTRTSYLVPKESTAGIKSSDDLCGKTVAGVAASITEDQVKKLTAWCTGKGKAAVTFVGLADTNAIILAAKAGRADAAAMTESAAIDAITKEPDAYSYVTQSDAQGAGVDQLALLVPKASKLGPVMFDAFKKLFSTGEYTRIMNKHGLQKVVVPAPLFNTAAAP
jgi:polar amino acid transport system substrate-binding protein